MRIVITGGCGFLGRRVAMRLLDSGTARGPVDELVLFDNAPPALPLPDDSRLSVVTGDIADRETVARLIAPGTDAVFHLAAIVSGQAEADTDLGYRVNLDGTRAVLDACRALGHTAPRLDLRQLAGGLWRRAAAGGRRRHGADAANLLRHAEGDRRIAGQRLQPQGLCRRPALRLPTVVVRPGRPNRAASTFASSMIREPLTGRTRSARCRPTRSWRWPRRAASSPGWCMRSTCRATRSARAARCNCRGSRCRSARWPRRCAAPPARRPTARIRWQPDPQIQAIISSWPQALATPRAEALGFGRDSGIDEVVAAFIEDDLPLQRQLAG